jgi:hypothetical protein
MLCVKIVSRILLSLLGQWGPINIGFMLGLATCNWRKNGVVIKQGRAQW